MDASWNPPVELTYVTRPGLSVAVVRDDLLPGGTKQRGAVPFLEAKRQQGYQEFVYASPLAGFAQIALAYSCCKVGTHCTIFAEAATAGGLSEFSLQAKEMATVYECATLDEATAKAYYHAMANTSRCLLPLGLNDPLFRKHFTQALQQQWRTLERLCRPLRRIWTSVGSGTFITTLRQVVPETVGLVAVDVGVLAPDDPRITAVRALPNTDYYRVDYPFRTPCPVSPPIPSNAFYDAKVWPLVQQHYRSHDVWWNIAR